MDLISLLVALLILGLVFWLVVTYILPLLPAGPFRTVAIIIFVLIAILILLSFIGIGPGLGVRIGR